MLRLSIPNTAIPASRSINFSMMEKAVLGFGSNLRNRLGNISAALKMLSLTKGLDLLASSSVYETEPWGYTRQNNFLNLCAVFLCSLSPEELFKTIKITEKKLGRVYRGKWKAREI